MSRFRGLEDVYISRLVCEQNSNLSPKLLLADYCISAVCRYYPLSSSEFQTILNGRALVSFANTVKKKPLLLYQVARRRKGNGSTPLGYNNSTLHRVIKASQVFSSVFSLRCQMLIGVIGFRDCMIQVGDSPKCVLVSFLFSSEH
jgi:hypothetical protein